LQDTDIDDQLNHPFPDGRIVRYASPDIVINSVLNQERPQRRDNRQ
jgi:hypothetical protein